MSPATRGILVLPDLKSLAHKETVVILVSLENVDFQVLQGHLGSQAVTVYRVLKVVKVTWELWDLLDQLDLLEILAVPVFLAPKVLMDFLVSLVLMAILELGVTRENAVLWVHQEVLTEVV